MESAFDNPGYEKSPTNSRHSVDEQTSVHEIVEEVGLETTVPIPIAVSSEIDTIEKSGEEHIFNLTPKMTAPAAVSVRNAYKSYQKGFPVLDDFSMTVPVGSIYSLLGASGCGKTTLLSCCVGLRNLDSGDIFVFGHKPGTKESGVPGRRIGYMPQELSLYNELTIQEALNFYGRIYGMEKKEMLESSTFLVDFLDLPKATRRVGSLSGGQKRRVSIAIALLHSPELMILDEPTVGVDPLLRESIWGHLVKLVESGTTTVIITTHYIEEARQSNVIGIMRNGRLLAEKSPDALIKEFNVNHLEDIVLTLCRMDREAKKNKKQDEPDQKSLEWSINTFSKRKVSSAPDDISVIGIRYESDKRNGASQPVPEAITEESANDKGTLQTNLQQFPSVTIPSLKGMDEEGANHKNGNGVLAGYQMPQALAMPESTPFQHSTPVRRLTALLIKNFIILIRNIGFLIFIFLVPAIQVILICLTIGSDPKGLLLGVVNPEPCDFESSNWRNISMTCPIKNIAPENGTEKEGTLSCFYLSMLPEESFILEREPTEEKALQRIQTGYTYGYIQFPVDYTENVMCRFGNKFIGCTSTIEEIYAGSNILMELDMSNKQIGQTMKRIFVETYTAAMDRLKTNCQPRENEEESEKPEMGGEIPYVFKKPVYGKDDTSFREFLAPSILLGLLFFFPLCSSGVSYITEKKTGTLDRAIVSGVGTTELMGGFLISQVGILLGQAGFAFLILTQVFHIEILGSVSLALCLTILVGISGMSAGFLIAMFCSEEVQAVLLAIGTFFPNILLAGMVWPLEGMDRSLQYVSYLLPCTLACESMRSIISRGWTLGHRTVWPGFLSTFAWIVVYWVLAVVVHRIKNKA